MILSYGNSNRISVNCAATRKDERSSFRCSHCFEQVERANAIVVVVNVRARHGLAYISKRSQVNDQIRSHVANYGSNELTLQQAAFNQRAPPDCVTPASRQIVKRNNFPPRPSERFAAMGADVPRTSDDECRTHEG